MSTVYAGNQAEVSFTAADFDRAGMTAADVVGVQLSIFDSSGTLVATSVMGFTTDPENRWTYMWTTPAATQDETYRLEAVLTALDGGLTTAWGEFVVQAAPTVPEPASKHFLAPWCEEADIPAGLLLDSNNNPIRDVNLGEMICAATEALFIRSGSKYKSGRSVVRPTHVEDGYGNQSFLYPYSSMSGYGSAWGFDAGWSWTAMGMGWWQSGQDLSEVVLQAPVRRINSVIVDGVALAPNQYALYDQRRLVRVIDPAGQLSGAWPWNQQLQVPVTMPGTFQIDYEWGHVRPTLGKLACVELASTLAVTISGQDPSKLPARVQQVNTQGTQVAVGDALQYLLADFTGLPVTDLFLKTYNPSGRRKRSAFISPNAVLNRSS